MIYEELRPNAPIRQGDIFVKLPKVEISLERMALFTQSGQTAELSWREVAQRGSGVTAVLHAKILAGYGQTA